LEKAKIVYEIQQYIEENLYEKITLSTLARAVNYSISYCERIFKEYTNKSPYEYIRILRLTNAARILRDNKVKIIDVSLDFVFDSHEGFTRAFSKEFGISPKKYQNNPIPLKYFIPFNARDSFIFKTKGENKNMSVEKKHTVFVQVVERPERKAIIKRGLKADHYFDYCEEVGCDVWGVLESIKEAMFEPAGFWLPKKLINSNTSKYVQGVEVPLGYEGLVPEGFELITLEAVKYMVFQGEPYDDENFGEAIHDIWESIKKYDPNLYGYEWADEDAPRFQLIPMGYRGYIEARPVRNLRLKD